MGGHPPTLNSGMVSSPYKGILWPLSWALTIEFFVAFSVAPHHCFKGDIVVVFLAPTIEFPIGPTIVSVDPLPRGGGFFIGLLPLYFTFYLGRHQL